ncbi:MAG: DUF1801 domain-containing protein [Devosia sp.]
MASKTTKKASFSADEKAAMKERAAELKAEKGKADGEQLALEAIAKMPEPDRALAKKVHAIVKASAPSLSAKTWYGMPAYADKDGKIVCFFQDANKFKARYATLGFTDVAKLDDGNMWPSSFALKKLSTADESKIRALVKQAVG